MNRRLALWLVALVAGAAALAQVLLTPPSTREQMHLLAILAAPAVVTAA